MHNRQMENLVLKLEHDDFSGYNMNARHPKITYTKPRMTQGYDTYQVEDITVYVERGISTTDSELTFVDHQYKGHHECEVIGMNQHK